MRSASLALAAAGLALLTAASPIAQHTGTAPPPSASPAPQFLLDAFGVSRGTVQRPSLPSSGRQPFRFSVVLGGAPVTIALQPYELRTADFRLLLDDGGDTLTAAATPSAST